jgi:hypothetical protein
LFACVLKSVAARKINLDRYGLRADNGDNQRGGLLVASSFPDLTKPVTVDPMKVNVAF